MRVRKAVITAAAPDQNRLPLQQLVDQDGNDKTALQLIIQETLAAGVEQVAVIIRPGDEHAYQSAAGNLVNDLTFIPQANPAGYADAIFRASDFIGDDAFLHLVGDHLYVSSIDTPCAKQLIDVASRYDCSVSAVQATRESNLPYFGVVSGPRVAREERLFEIENVVEKPTPTLAEQDLVTPGLRAGLYLGFFGMHVLTPQVLRLIGELHRESPSTKWTLADAMAMLHGREKYVAYQMRGSRYNLGVQYGLLRAQLAIGLSGRDRQLILAEMVEVLADRLEEAPVR
ncbi:MAG: sugar phosphate nucleotidyltransferase [Planctomycetota bacterium]